MAPRVALIHVFFGVRFLLRTPPQLSNAVKVRLFFFNFLSGMEFRLCDVLFCDLEVEGKFVSRLVRGVFSYGCKNYYCMFSNHVQGHYLRKEMVVD